MGGEIFIVTLLPNKGGEREHNKGALGGYPAMDEEAAIVRNAEKNRRDRYEVGNRRESSVDRVSVNASHVTESFGVVRGRRRENTCRVML